MLSILLLVVQGECVCGTPIEEIAVVFVRSVLKDLEKTDKIILGTAETLLQM